MNEETGTRVVRISYQARAKINLDLMITGRRDDGYHLLDSLVVFADYGDEIFVRQSPNLRLNITGPFSKGLSVMQDNLVLKAASLLQNKFNIRQGAEIELVKNLPVSSGIGGGSADAAATIQALRDLWQITCDDGDLKDLLLSLGADVPVCLASQTMQMTGIGEILRPVSLNFSLVLLLVNPGVAVSTAGIFTARAGRHVAFSSARILPDTIWEMEELIDILHSTGNDLTYDACALEPEITIVLQNIKESNQCMHAGMSGSGATCFGFFPDLNAAQEQADNICRTFPAWWAVPVTVC
ncbi:MAG: 4-(cytidine 5'-diphospho)-2-C-methyl-D-erythritol kinase [Emcibacter sp.]|nr:4-(cytidine 5'-diphospho)-2-C-methyl-D-erythritol kinase [Emcibacter sp.]